MNLYGTVGGATGYVAVRRVWETQPEAGIVCTQQLGKKQFWYGQYKSDCPLSSRGHIQAWEGNSSSHEVVAAERLLPLCDAL